MSMLSVVFRYGKVKGMEIICLYWQLKKIIPTNNILTTFRQGFVQTYSSDIALLHLAVDIPPPKNFLPLYFIFQNLSIVCITSSL